jgi:hypothetical protein
MGEKARFLEDSWLNGRRPKDIAPLIFKFSKKKKSTVSKAIDGSSWIAQVNANDSLSLEHIVQFYTLWEMLQSVHIDANIPDTLTWKLSNNGCYSSKSAYNMQNLEQTSSLLPRLVWEPWAHPKCKTFAWLII